MHDCGQQENNKRGTNTRHALTETWKIDVTDQPIMHLARKNIGYSELKGLERHRDLGLKKHTWCVPQAPVS